MRPCVSVAESYGKFRCVDEGLAYAERALPLRIIAEQQAESKQLQAEFTVT
jgi:hypothetical protein